jgi:hypothetical protein
VHEARGEEPDCDWARDQRSNAAKSLDYCQPWSERFSRFRNLWLLISIGGSESLHLWMNQDPALIFLHLKKLQNRHSERHFVTHQKPLKRILCRLRSGHVTSVTCSALLHHLVPQRATFLKEREAKDLYWCVANQGTWWCRAREIFARGGEHVTLGHCGKQWITKLSVDF